MAETQSVFLDGGTVDFVLRAMQRRPEDKGTLIMGFIALSALAWQNRAGGARLLAALEALDRLLVRVCAVWYAVVRHMLGLVSSSNPLFSNISSAHHRPASSRRGPTCSSTG